MVLVNYNFGFLISANATFVEWAMFSVREVLKVMCVTVLVMTMYACNETDDGSSHVVSTPTSTSFSPEILLQESGIAMSTLNSFRFDLHHKSGTTILLPNLLMENAQGHVVKPDKMSVQFTGAFGSFAIKSSLITMGDKSYMTNPLTGNWEAMQKRTNPLGFFDPLGGITSIMLFIDDAFVVYNDDEVYVVQGVLATEHLSSLVGDTLEGEMVDLELKIHSDTKYLMEAVISGEIMLDDSDGIVRVIKLSEFNKPVNVDLPK